MKHQTLKTLLLSACLTASSSYAQLSKNPDKFLGNITTSYQVDPPGLKFYEYWNQITGENESKWGSIEVSRNNYNWNGSDNCANYAKNHKFPFKFHAIIWGAQYPNWFNSDLSTYERKQAIYNWMNAMKTHYRTIDLIDVANECVAGHQPDTWLFQDPLGGTGETGWDWLINAFKKAHELWPEAILIYNDFNTFQWNTDQFISLVTALRDGGAPIDAYGCQSHDLTDCNITNFKNSMNKLQNSLKMPMYITEYDLGTDNDNHQKNQLAAQFPVMWEADYCAGVTLWGWIYGKTWTTNGNSGLIKDGVDRPAMKWLKEYMATDAAANAKSPYPGMKKPISFYIQPKYYKAPINEPCPINIEATTHNGTKVEKVEFFVNNNLVATLTEAPFVYDYTPTSTSKVNLKAIAYTSDGKTYERLGGMYGSKWGRHPYTPDNKPLVIPGVLEAEDFDMGGEGISYHTTRTSASSSNYRDDQEKVGIFSLSSGGYAIEQPAEGEWYDYTIECTKAGKINCEGIVGSMAENAEFQIFTYKDGEMKSMKTVSVPYTGRKKYTTVDFDLGLRMAKGEYKLRIYFNKAKVSIDKFYIGTTTTGIDTFAEAADAALYDIFTVSGIRIGRVEADNIQDAIRKTRSQTSTSGTYIIKNTVTGESKAAVIKP